MTGTDASGATWGRRAFASSPSGDRTQEAPSSSSSSSSSRTHPDRGHPKARHLSDELDHDGTESLTAAPQKKRAVLYFTIDADALPPDSGWPEGIDLTMGVVALSSDEELEAARLAKDGVSAEYEYVKRALRKVQEPGASAPRDIDRSAQEHEELWERIGPRGRICCSLAYKEIGTAGKEVVLKLRTSFRWGV